MRTVTVADGGLNVRTTPQDGIVDDEYPSGDPTIATGRDRALLAWSALARDERGTTLHRVRFGELPTLNVGRVAPRWSPRIFAKSLLIFSATSCVSGRCCSGSSAVDQRELRGRDASGGSPATVLV